MTAAMLTTVAGVLPTLTNINLRTGFWFDCGSDGHDLKPRVMTFGRCVAMNWARPKLILRLVSLASLSVTQTLATAKAAMTAIAREMTAPLWLSKNSIKFRTLEKKELKAVIPVGFLVLQPAA